MKKLLQVILLLFISFSTKAQSFKTAKSYSVLKYKVDNRATDFKKFHIKGYYGSGNLKTFEYPEDFIAKNIVAIDYYYTAFKSDTSFNQARIDSLRFSKLKFKYPDVAHLIDSVPLRIIEQTLAHNKKEALFYFHGFVLHYKPKEVLPEAREKEITKIKSLFKSNFKFDKTPPFGSIRLITGGRREDIFNVWGKEIELLKPSKTIHAYAGDIPGYVERTIDTNDFVLCYTEGKKITYDTLKVNIYKIGKRYYPGSIPPAFTSGNFGMKPVSFENGKLKYLAKQRPIFRNEVSGQLYKSLKAFEDDSIVVVIDVTGSMTNAIGQVLKWIHHENIKPKIKGVVLFNDGDKKRNSEKLIGNTGGIYTIKELKNLQETLIKSMRAGSGGDLPENDLEAVLSARKTFGKASYVLIADNLSKPRDFKLVSQIRFPLNILICNGLIAKEDYVDIAEVTGGRIINFVK